LITYSLCLFGFLWHYLSGRAILLRHGTDTPARFKVKGAFSPLEQLLKSELAAPKITFSSCP
jgi:hypothetical protein